MLWVHGTLVETSLALYCRFVHRLSADQRDAYYRDMALVARIFGTPKDVIPPTLPDFRACFAERLASPEIGVTEPAHEVAEVILRASSPPAPLRLIAPAHRLSTAALLPPRLREEYGLDWGVRKALALRGGRNRSSSPQHRSSSSPRASPRRSLPSAPAPLLAAESALLRWKLRMARRKSTSRKAGQKTSVKYSSLGAARAGNPLSRCSPLVR
jgi:uncharacterized protein (DUF2236 family)